MDSEKIFDYECNNQISIFDLTMPMIHIDKPIRLIELFAGYGSQAMALKRIGAKFEHWKVCEFDKYAVASYNAVHGTDFVPTDIKSLHGKDLDITETDKYCYMMTYSFPCTDLSVAGKMAGMKKGSGTRSGLLWEVERLLTEIHESNGELPQVLFMENVPQVISSANIKDFHAWQDFLSELGYTSYIKVLNAKDYGVAQNRERCFMFSFLGKYNYHFPEPIPLTKTMKDYLEDEVDEKYYINSEKAQKLIETLMADNRIATKSEIGLSVIGSLNPKKECQDRARVFSSDGISPGLRAADYKDPTKIVESVLQIGNIAEESTFSNPQIGRVYDSNGCAPTLNTCSGGSHEPKICVDLSIKNPSENNIANCITSRENRGISNQQSVGNGVIVAMRGRNPDNPSDRTPGNHVEQRLEPNSQGICNTLMSVQKDNLVLESSILTPKRTEFGKRIRKAYESGVVKESRHNMTQLEPRTDGISNTLTTVQKDNMVLERCIDLYNQKQRTDELCGTLTTNSGTQFHCGSMGIVEKVRIKQATKDGYIECKLGGVACPTITAAETGICKIESEYRIRKLTPRECGRLMDVSDEDITKMEAVNSNSQLYKQFGNSIVVGVMAAMFKQLF